MFGEEIADELIPRVFEIELQFGPAIERGVATNEIRYQIDRYTYTGTIIWIAAAGTQTLSLLKLPGLC